MSQSLRHSTIGRVESVAAIAQTTPGTEGDTAGRPRTLRLALSGACLAFLLAGLIVEFAGVPTWAAVSVFVAAYIAGGVFSAAEVIGALARGRITIDLLMLTAAAGAASLGHWPEGAFLLFLFSLSGALEAMILSRTRRAIAELLDLTPDTAVVIRSGLEISVPADSLQAGDVVLIRPGGRIPADGVIESGASAVDESAMTGESIPATKSPGDEVLAGTINTHGSFTFSVTRAAGQTALARMVRLATEAQAKRAQSQRFTDWFGAYYTSGVLVVSALLALVPILLRLEPAGDSFTRAITVLVVASPCAVVIAIPATILAAIAGAARHGVLFKGGVHVEDCARIKAVAIDKTGTLTMGKPEVTELLPSTGASQRDLLGSAAIAEARTEHPLGLAIFARAEAESIAVPKDVHAEAIIGQGIAATQAGVEYLVGKPGLLESRGIEVDDATLRLFHDLQVNGRTAVLVARGGALMGVIGLRDTLRPTAGPSVSALQEMGIAVVMLTGDNQRVADAIADDLSIQARAALMPHEKLEHVRTLRDSVGPVLMVGDGVNDAPALAAADVGMTLGGAGTDAALEASDAVVMGYDLVRIPEAIRHARRATQVIKQNLVFAFSVMLILLAITMVGRLPMPAAVIGHEGSTVLVILNGLRLLRFSRLHVREAGEKIPD